MLAYNVLLLLILASVPLSYINKKVEIGLLIIWGMILTIFAATREIGVDRDSYNYSLLFYLFQSYLDSLKFGVEPAISSFTVILKQIGFDSIYALFFIFAVISIPIKIRVIAKFSPIPILSILLYYVYMYFKQDFTAIRVAVAIGVFFWSINDIFTRNWKIYFLKILLACCFHFSAVFYFPIYFVKLHEFNRKKYLIILLGSCIFSNLHLFDFISKLPVISTVSKVQQYSEKVANSTVLPFNPHGLYFMFNLIIIIFIMYFYENIINKDAKAIFFIKCVVYGNVLNFIFGPVSATLGGRISDLYLIFMCITYSYFIYFIRPYYIAVIISIFIALILYWFNMGYTNIVYEYNSWIF